MSIIIEDTGLLVGLISYPFEKNGSKFFKYEFQENLFGNYKNNIINNLEKDKQEQYRQSGLYQPAGYHLFGNYNLAVLASVDGYAFGNRIFHPGHGHSQASQEAEMQYADIDYNYQLLTGISYHHDRTPHKQIQEITLINKTKATFQKTTEKYPFIGITRFKLNNSILIGTGIEFNCAIRETIEQHLRKFKKKKEYQETATRIDAFSIDCFGNSEITLLTFSNNLEAIYDFISQIKELQVKALDGFNPSGSLLAERAKKDITPAHVFSSSYTNSGYNIEWGQEKGSFLPIVKNDQLRAQIKWEMKPGHDGEIWNIQEQAREILAPETSSKKNVRQHLMEANPLYTQILNFDLDRFDSLMQKFGQDSDITRHIKDFRVQFYNNKTLARDSEEIHPGYKKLPDLGISSPDMEKIRDNLRQCGASKLTKERVLKMLARYNNCIRDKHFYIYFIELRNFLEGTQEALAQFANKESLSIEYIDNYMDQVITAFESAHYNRFHQSTRMGTLADFNLEYNGGIQQYVTSFDLVYKQALKTLTYEQKKEQYERSFVYVSGYENVISKREMLRINMHLITYPELFAVSIFKETGNYLLGRSDNKPTFKQENVYRNKPDEKHLSKLIQNWRTAIRERQLPKNLMKSVRSSPQFRPDLISHRQMENIVDHELVEYFIVDIHNLYFGFNNDFDLMYYFYWKYFLQISQAYNRNGELELKHFITFLTRLLIIQLYVYENEHRKEQMENNGDKQADMTAWLKETKGKIMQNLALHPFDPHLSNLWYCHFGDILDIVVVIWQNLQLHQFQELLNTSIFALIKDRIQEEYITYLNFSIFLKEDNLSYKEYIDIFRENPDFIGELNKIRELMPKAFFKFAFDDNKDRLRAFHEQIRTARIEKIVQSFKEKKLIRLDKNDSSDDPYFVSNILIAYLKIIRELDDPQQSPCPLKQLSRNEKGKVLKDDRQNAAQSFLLSDPQGGFFTRGSKARRLYFTYRTILYKSLWDYAIKMKKDKILESIK